MYKLIINFAPTGMLPTKEITPHVPISSEEIIKEVSKCTRLGASIIHIHARDEQGDPTYKKEIFRQIIKGIRKENKDLILCVTTSGRIVSEFEKRAEVLDLEDGYKPDMANLTLGSMNFSKQASINTPDIIQALLNKMTSQQIKPELEVFDLGMINYAKYLIKKELLAPPYYFNLLFGNIASAQPNLLTIAHLINELPEKSIWSLAGIGNCQHFITSLAIPAGGHVRIGLEDFIYFDSNRKILATNEMLISRIRQIADSIGIPVATPQEVRDLLNLPGWINRNIIDLMGLTVAKLPENGVYRYNSYVFPEYRGKSIFKCLIHAIYSSMKHEKYEFCANMVDRANQPSIAAIKHFNVTFQKANILKLPGYQPFGIGPKIKMGSSLLSE